MSFTLTTADYVEFLNRAYKKIHEHGDYITGLDAATGDGDHWTNLNMGFEKLVSMSSELASLSLFEAFKKIGMVMMNTIGGSGGALYGSAYIEAAKSVKELDVLTGKDVCGILSAMLEGIMKRGKSEPGMKTMIDALHPAVQGYKEAIDQGRSDRETIEAVKQATIDGVESTRDMEAVRGRAYYQKDRGVGHLDPGAVTMGYQIEVLMDFISEKI